MPSKNTNEFPVKLSQPAQRALSGAGIKTLAQLSKITEEELNDLHGIGPNTISAIKNAMVEHRISFLKKNAAKPK